METFLMLKKKQLGQQNTLKILVNLCVTQNAGCDLNLNVGFAKMLINCFGTLHTLKYDKIFDVDAPDLRPTVFSVQSSSLYYILYQQHIRTVVVIVHQRLWAVTGYATAL